MTEAAFRRGFGAYLAEKLETDNPFPQEVDEHGAWLTGYLSARKRSGKRRLVAAVEELESLIDLMTLVPDTVPELVHLTQGEMRELVRAARFTLSLPWWAKFLRRYTL